MVGAGALFILRVILVEALGFLFFPSALIVSSFFLALAFFKPGERPFEVYLLSIIGSLTRPSKRVWKKVPYKEDHQQKIQKKEEYIAPKKVSSMDLQRLSFIVDSGGFTDELASHGISAGIQEAKKLEEKVDLKDTLAATEKPNENLSGLLEQASKKTEEKRKEPTIQELSSVKSSKGFIYEKLKNSSGVLTDYEELVENAKKEQEKRFETAKIHH